MPIFTKRNLAYAALALGLAAATGGGLAIVCGSAKSAPVFNTVLASSKAGAMIAAKGAIVGTGLAVKGYVIIVGGVKIFANLLEITSDALDLLDTMSRRGIVPAVAVDLQAFIGRSIQRFVKAGLLVGGVYCTLTLSAAEATVAGACAAVAFAFTYKSEGEAARGYAHPHAHVVHHQPIVLNFFELDAVRQFGPREFNDDDHFRFEVVDRVDEEGWGH